MLHAARPVTAPSTISLTPRALRTPRVRPAWLCTSNVSLTVRCCSPGLRGVRAWVPAAGRRSRGIGRFGHAQGRRSCAPSAQQMQAVPSRVVGLAGAAHPRHDAGEREDVPTARRGERAARFFCHPTCTCLLDSACNHRPHVVSGNDIAESAPFRSAGAETGRDTAVQLLLTWISSRIAVMAHLTHPGRRIAAGRPPASRQSWQAVVPLATRPHGPLRRSLITAASRCAAKAPAVRHVRCVRAWRGVAAPELTHRGAHKHSRGSGTCGVRSCCTSAAQAAMTEWPSLLAGPGAAATDARQLAAQRTTRAPRHPQPPLPPPSSGGSGGDPPSPSPSPVPDALPVAGPDTDWRAYRARLAAMEAAVAERPGASGSGCTAGAGTPPAAQFSSGKWAHALPVPETGAVLLAHPSMFGVSRGAGSGEGRNRMVRGPCYTRLATRTHRHGPFAAVQHKASPRRAHRHTSWLAPRTHPWPTRTPPPPKASQTYFRLASILLLEVNEQGALGIILNRPTEHSLRDLQFSSDAPVDGVFRANRCVWRRPVDRGCTAACKPHGALASNAALSAASPLGPETRAS